MNKITDKTFTDVVNHAIKLKTKEEDILEVIRLTLEKFNIQDDGIISFQLAYALRM